MMILRVRWLLLIFDIHPGSYFTSFSPRSALTMLSFWSQGLSAGLLWLAATSSAHSAAILPRLNNVTLSSVSTQGAGCPKGTVSTLISTDGTTITFIFDQFETYYGPAYPPTQKSKTCTINLELGYYSGNTFAVVDTTYRGSAMLSTGMSAAIASTYRITSDEAGDRTVQIRDVVPGGSVDEYIKTVSVPAASTLNSPCGRGGATLQVNTRVSVSSNSTTVAGSVTGDPDFSLRYQQLHLGWSACKE